MSESCQCGTAPKLIFACSGGADVGALTDQTARELTRDGIGKMYCLAGIGGQVSGIIKSTEAASVILVIDGCPINCAKKCLETAGFINIKHIQLTDIGMIKGKTEINNINIQKVADHAKVLLEENCL